MSTCDECKYCVESRCRFNAPVYISDNNYGHWPPVDPFVSWCGKFEPKTTTLSFGGNLKLSIPGHEFNSGDLVYINDRCYRYSVVNNIFSLFY